MSFKETFDTHRPINPMSLLGIVLGVWIVADTPGELPESTWVVVPMGYMFLFEYMLRLARYLAGQVKGKVL